MVFNIETGIFQDDIKFLETLADVNIQDPQNGQAVVYNATTKKYENADVGGGGGGGGGGALTVTDLTVTGDLSVDRNNTVIYNDSLYTSNTNDCVYLRGKNIVSVNENNSDFGFMLKRPGSNGYQLAKMIEYQNGGITISRGGGVNNSSIRVVCDGRNGNLEYYGSLVNVSDDRLKINERPITNALNQIMNTQFYEYEKVGTLNGTDVIKTERGVIAQQLQGTSFDYTVSTTDMDEGQDTFTVAYDEIFVTLCQAVKDQQSIIEDLRTRIVALENK